MTDHIHDWRGPRGSDLEHDDDRLVCRTCGKRETLCGTCGLRHAGPEGRIEIRDPDDEIGGCGGIFHVERMSNHHVWIGFTQPDGERVTLSLSSKRRVRMFVQDER